MRRDGWRRSDQCPVIALASGAASELDGSRERCMEAELGTQTQNVLAPMIRPWACVLVVTGSRRPAAQRARRRTGRNRTPNRMTSGPNLEVRRRVARPRR
jgi:hypothetical protein